MAALFNTFDATPDSCTITIAGVDGAADAYPYSTFFGDDIRRHLVAGPLLQEMDRRAAGAGGLVTINLDGTQSGVIRARQIYGVNAVQSTPGAYNIHWNAAELSAQVPAATNITIEVRFEHSSDR